MVVADVPWHDVSHGDKHHMMPFFTSLESEISLRGVKLRLWDSKYAMPWTQTVVAISDILMPQDDILVDVEQNQTLDGNLGH